MRRMVLVAGFMLALSSLALAHPDSDVTCRHNENNFGDELQTSMTQEQFTVPMSGSQLKVTAAKNGGVKLIGGTGSAYEVTVCKYAGADSKAEADQLLGKISAEHSATEISVRGPQDSHWTAQLIIKVPQNANMSVSAINGPISAKGISGTLALQAKNGPIDINGVKGKVSAHAQNGPISFHGESGEYSLETQNGPLDINLAQNWQNGTLDARTENGPIELNLPKGYTSGVEVRSDGHSPMECSADACSEARKTWDDNGKKIEFGPSNPVIHLSTHNGPVSVENQDRKEEAEM
jgi:Putative adhesin